MAVSALGGGRGDEMLVERCREKEGRAMRRQRVENVEG